MIINAKILSDKITPGMLTPKTPGSAGIDLMAVNLPDPGLDYWYLYPGQSDKIGAGISIHLDNPGYAAVLLPRSGMGHKGLVLGNLVGLVDSDFTGEIILSVWNRSADTIKINLLDRIAQIIVIPVIQPQFNFVDSLEDTERGAGSFGSTGINFLSKDK